MRNSQNQVVDFFIAFVRIVETCRIILRGEKQDYINAVSINVRECHTVLCATIDGIIVVHYQGYKQQQAYIIAQNPLKSTVRNFWKVITDRKCGSCGDALSRSARGKVL